MMWEVPLADLDIGPAEIEAVVNVLKSGWLSMGRVTQEFERQFTDYVGTKHGFAVSNGTTALHLAHAALDIGPGDEVIVPSLTFVATANAVLYTGATPVFADITSLDNLNVSLEDIEAKISPRTRAITVVHYGGFLCDMEQITNIAQRHGLFVIEDAAHAPGAELNGQKAGAIGDVGCFSFFSNKNLATGEGGMIVTDRDDIAQRIAHMRSHGMTTLTWDRHQGHAHSYDVVELGYNYRLDEMRAALGLVQLGRLSENNERRRALVQKYRRALKGRPGLQLPFESFIGTPAFHIFPVILSPNISRPAVISELRRHRIQTSVHYPPIHEFSYYRKRFGDQKGSLPLTEHVGQQELTLPLYPTMTDEALERVVQAMNAVLLTS
jgi:dTDP-4-amino-4,6-dideoxygalactose transaminase